MAISIPTDRATAFALLCRYRSAVEAKERAEAELEAVASEVAALLNTIFPLHGDTK